MLVQVDTKSGRTHEITIEGEHGGDVAQAGHIWHEAIRGSRAVGVSDDDGTLYVFNTQEIECVRVTP